MGEVESKEGDEVKSTEIPEGAAAIGGIAFLKGRSFPYLPRLSQNIGLPNFAGRPDTEYLLAFA